jgi:NTE family protein
MRIWSELTIDKVVDVPPEMLKGKKIKFSLKNLSRIGDLNLNFKNLGLNTDPLYKILKSEVKEDQIRRSGIDLGIVTVRTGLFQPCEIFLDDMPHGSLPDYLLASASFPAFRRAEINGKQFIDGAFHDNIPHAMMKNRGYRKIIVVDISGLGVNKRPDVVGTDTIYIKTSRPLGNVLDFDPDQAMKAIELGYLDTMKVFEKNDGLKYFILRDKKTEQEYSARLLRKEYIEKYSQYLKLNGRKCTADNAEALIREILPKDLKSNRNLLLCLLESAAATLDIERLRTYTVPELIEAVRVKFASVMQSGNLPSRTESESFFKRLEETIEETLSLFLSDREMSNYCPYEYAKIMRSSRAAETLFPELLPAEVFLSLL